jgi:choice-of-anchor B domain-containing protein
MMRHHTLAFALLAVIVLPASAQYAPQFGATVAVGDDGQIFVSEGRNLLLPGNVFVYEQAADGSWTQAAALAPDDATNEPNGFGRTFAVWDATVVVGAPTVGAAYVFTRGADGAWKQSSRLTAEAEGFGSSVALNGDNLLIGASGGREAAGTVYAYRRGADGAWAQAGTLAVEGVEASDGYGSTLAVQGVNAIVAAPNTQSRTGTVYAFRFADGAWQPTGPIDFRGAGEGARFGASLLLLGTHLVAGLPGHDNGIGAADIFQIDEETGTWSFESRVAPFAARGGEQFGTALAFTHDRLWVGAPGFNGREGMIYQFEPDPATGRMNGTWQMSPDALQYRASFGTALAANDRVAVAGAVGYDNFEGAAFPFTPDADGWGETAPLFNDSGTFTTVTGDQVECQDGEAGAFGCDNVDMVSFLSRGDIGARRGIQVNDVWGWEDPETGREYALIGRTDGTSFVDLTDASNPIFVGDLPKTETANQSLWRDIKVYKDHAYIVADGAGAHHMQIFDLTQLRDVQNPPATFEETAIYKGIYSSHNIIINEETGYAYAVGSDSGGETCGGALHMINIQDPANPSFAGCFADTRTGRRGSGATHDAQCVSYHGPDADYQGREICLSSNGTALSIADVTDKENPSAISMAEYPNVAYTHQGWLTEDHRYFYLNDEGDEVSGLTDATRTMILDLEDLDEPEVAGFYLADHNAIDHNLYVKGNLMYQTNYTAGLRILDISDPENPTEVGFFDTVPYGKNDNSPVLGAWSNYPYFKSGVIVVTSGREGVFFLKKKPVDL